MPANKMFFGLACAFSSLAAAAQWNDNPAVNTPVCTTATTHQFKPQSSPDGSGGFFITWMEANADFSSGSIYTQHLSSTGTRLWAAEGISVNGASGLFSDPQVIADGNGGAIISWIQNVSGVLRHYVQKVSGSGQLQWNAGGVLVCPTTVTPLQTYKLISDNKGGAIVLWDDTRANNNQVYAQRFDPDGNLLWPADGLACTSDFTSLNSFDAVADSSGGVFIAYSMTTNLLYWNEIILQHITPDGSTHWGDAGEALSNAQGDQLYASIAIDSLDNVIVAWQDFRLDPVISQIWGQRINASRELKWGLGGKMLVDSVVPERVLAKVVTDTSRGAIITWLDDFTQSQNMTAYLFGIRIDSTGSTVWPKSEVATWPAQQLPGEYELVPDFKSGAFVSWQTAASLSAQHILPTGSTEFGLSGKVVSTVPLVLPRLTCDSNGIAIAAWTDLRSGTNYDLYAARLSPTSSLPVHWTGFSGSLNGTVVLLDWQTTHEENNTGYVVQRSVNGLQFDSIGFVTAADMPSLNYNYSFTDQQPLAGSNYYRLKQIDIDGKFTYSRTIRVDFEIKHAITISPNPAPGYIVIDGAKAGSIISLYGMNGRKYKEVKSVGGKVQIETNRLPAGQYVVRIIQPGEAKMRSRLITVVRH